MKGSCGDSSCGDSRLTGTRFRASLGKGTALAVPLSATNTPGFSPLGDFPRDAQDKS